MSNFLKLIRIKQWIKNILVFAPLIFSLNLFNDHFLIKTLIIFFSFSFASVFIYIINDIIDRDFDLKHPVKKFRPIASGVYSIKKAFFIAFIFLFLSILLSLINIKATFVIVFYVILNVFYTINLKKIVILDVFIIALGFCLRVLAGAIAIDVKVSKWILLTTFSVSLLLGFGKRRNELITLDNNASGHRKILSEYTKEILDIMITISTGITAISYALYTMEDKVISFFKTESLIYTFPFVIFGLFRYLYIIYFNSKGGFPEEDLLTDKYILLTVFLWGTMIVTLLYFKDIFLFLKDIKFNLFAFWFK